MEMMFVNWIILAGDKFARNEHFSHKQKKDNSQNIQLFYYLLSSLRSNVKHQTSKVDPEVGSVMGQPTSTTH